MSPSLSIFSAVFLLGLIAMTLAGCPQYNVYSKRLNGEAAYVYAESERRIKVLEAQAELDSAHLLNQAEIARAEGLRKATSIVSQSFGGPDNYLRYLWIQSIQNNGASIIYIPTEAGLPILEAGKQGR
jgi:regulator of protease activity HflC (stomatin/prohibitin superfamily)